MSKCPEIAFQKGQNMKTYFLLSLVLLVSCHSGSEEKGNYVEHTETTTVESRRGDEQKSREIKKFDFKIGRRFSIDGNEFQTSLGDHPLVKFLSHPNLDKMIKGKEECVFKASMSHELLNLKGRDRADFYNQIMKNPDDKLSFLIDYQIINNYKYIQKSEFDIIAIRPDGECSFMMDHSTYGSFSNGRGWIQGHIVKEKIAEEILAGADFLIYAKNKYVENNKWVSEENYIANQISEEGSVIFLMEKGIGSIGYSLGGSNVGMEYIFLGFLARSNLPILIKRDLSLSDQLFQYKFVAKEALRIENNSVAVKLVSKDKLGRLDLIVSGGVYVSRKVKGQNRLEYQDLSKLSFKLLIDGTMHDIEDFDFEFKKTKMGYRLTVNVNEFFENISFVMVGRINNNEEQYINLLEIFERVDY